LVPGCAPAGQAIMLQSKANTARRSTTFLPAGAMGRISNRFFAANATASSCRVIFDDFGSTGLLLPSLVKECHRPGDPGKFNVDGVPGVSNTLSAISSA
jgi:hypothetical protein